MYRAVLNHHSLPASLNKNNDGPGPQSHVMPSVRLETLRLHTSASLSCLILL